MKKTIILLSILTSTVLYASVDGEHQKSPKIFIGGGVGTPTVNDSAVQFKDSEDTNGLFDMGLTYHFMEDSILDENVFAELEYLFAGSDYTDSHFVLGSMNYIFHEQEEFSAYAGAVAGSQFVSWIQDPITDSDARKEDSVGGRFVYGAQIGIKVQFPEPNYSFYAKYQFLTGSDLTTKINGNPLYEENQNNFIMGVSYEF